jgi:hypothetical protein
VLWLACQGAHATWAEISDQDLIERSVLIVEATLIGKTRITLAGQGVTRRLAVLKVQRVYKGKTGEVVLLALPDRDPGIIVSTDIDYPVGETGIWFLRLDPASQEGIFLADHPQRLWSKRREHQLQGLLDGGAE